MSMREDEWHRRLEQPQAKQQEQQKCSDEDIFGGLTVMTD